MFPPVPSNPLVGQPRPPLPLLWAAELIATPPPVPTTAIWSRSDGLVTGAICRDEASAAIEVRSSHLGVQVRPAVLLAVARVPAGGRAVGRASGA